MKVPHKTPALDVAIDLCSYVSGFVDGEGCSCVSFQPSQRHRFGWEIRPSFSVSQNAERAELLYLIRDLWGCGSIRPDRSDRTIKFEVRGIQSLVDVVFPHFDRFPLRSSKRFDVSRMKFICHEMAGGRHLEVECFKKIVTIAMEMNPSGKRKYSGSEILSSLQPGERIVYAVGNHGST